MRVWLLLAVLIAVGVIPTVYWVFFGKDYCSLEASNRVIKLLCEAKLTDLLLALFTYCLVVVGGFQAYWMWRTVREAANASDATKENTERLLSDRRAYVFGGPGYRGVTPDNYNSVIFSIGNSGQTPGNLKRIAWGVYSEDDMLTSSGHCNYSNREDILPPNSWNNAYPHISFPIDWKEGRRIFTGRIFYKDVFGAHHHSSWGHYIYADGHDEPIEGAYSEWD